MPKYRLEFVREQYAEARVIAPSEEVVRAAATAELARGGGLEGQGWFIDGNDWSIQIVALPDDANCETGISVTGLLCCVVDSVWAGVPDSQKED